ncbi:MAG: OmpA family protein [Deltaproteobacteria bacterium]|nr:OmpA family protein [Deltaproteobacteria bacterium]
MALVLGACGHGEAEWQGKLRELTLAQAELRARTGERDHLQEELAALQAQNEAMARRLGDLGENVTRLQQDASRTATELTASQAREAELRRRQQQQELRLQTFRTMLQRFQAMISSGQLRVRPVRGRLVIELPAGILFDSGASQLRPEGQAVLAQVATVLRQIENRDFLVAGHTDNVQLRGGNVGHFGDNWGLSSERAVNVVRYLVQAGVATAHLGAAGYAEFQPAGPNDTDLGRQNNRRVEIILMPNIEELPDLSALDAPAGAAGAAGATPAPAPTPAPGTR